MKRKTLPSSILLDLIQDLKKAKEHLYLVENDFLTVKGQGPKTIERIENIKEQITKQVEKMTELN